MASSKTLNQKNLEALGAARLAELLLELSAGDAAAKRRLRLELAGTAGVGEVAREISKRLSAIAKARSFIDWDKIKPLVADLSAQHRAIVDQVGRNDPAEALSLLWRFMSLAGPVLDRCDDSSGRVGALFREAAHDLGPLAAAAKAEPLVLATRMFEALKTNSYGQYDELIEILAPVLGTDGLEQLKALFTAWGNETRSRPADKDRRVVGWSSRGAIHADEMEEYHRTRSARVALQQIADALGDVDAFIAQHDEKARRSRAIAAAIGRRLLDAGRAEEALAAIDVAEARGGWVPVEWEEVRTKALDALGRSEEAQAFRWACFDRTLNPEHLRSHLKKLPDFDDMAAEEKAMSHAMQSPDVHRALHFFLLWPALDHAARLVVERMPELDGNLYEILTPAAEALEEKHPLAATLVRRAMIDFTLSRARSSRYGHAGRHLTRCAEMANRIEAFGAFATHDVYVEQLRAARGRKSAFWGA